LVASSDFDNAMSNSSKKLKEHGKYQPDGGVGSEPPDAMLLTAVGDGSAEAFWRLWSRHQKSLRQLCLRLMDGHASDAEDALSQVMLKALGRLPSCAGKITHLEAWLHRLARNLCIDLRRERHRRTEIGESWKLTKLVEPISNQSKLPDEGELVIQQQIAALPVPLREPFMLHIVREIPVKEVASQLGLTPANVRKRVQLARARLRRDMAGSHGGNGNPRPSQKHRPGATPAKPPQRQSNQPAELFSSAAFIRTVRVKLPCGVEQLFHVFPSKAPFGLERRMKTLRSQVSQKPDNWEKRLELADLFHVTGDWDKAVVEWQKVLTLRPCLPAVLKLGDTLRKLGRIEAAINVFINARRQPSQSAAAGRHLDGWIALCQKNTARSLLEFQAAAGLEPENPAHWHGLALARRRAGTIPAALTALQHALNLNSNDLVALSLSHEMLLAAGEIEEASRRAQHLLKLAPLDLLTLRRLVDCRCQLKLTQGAACLETVRLLRRTQQVSQNPFLTHETLASFFLAQDKPQKALAAQREFSEAHPQCLDGRQNYSELLAATGLADRQPAELEVWKLPTTKHCHGACHGHEPARSLRA
jgi:RNA polymerase sigma-70 factor (ECF subfamily)